ncbi:MAG: phosphoenolpyruvate--protein phosphotransferase, partial [Lachnospiraceae bacterium]|nr:phosphoenolpyruvate--protein phosphotransferase [Lachnospiraceae bacterium]
LIRMTAENARAKHIPVGICGELASDIDLTASFLSWGIDELSVVPSAILPLREKIRNLSLT